MTRTFTSTFEDGTNDGFTGSLNSPETDESSTEQANRGTKSWKLSESSSTFSGRTRTFTATSGKRYILFARVYISSGAISNVGISVSGGDGTEALAEKTGEWHGISTVVDATSTGGIAAQLKVKNSAVAYFDDVVLWELTVDSVDDYIGPILDKMKLILEAGFNAFVDEIDSSLPNIDNDAIRIEDHELFTERLPWINIFPDGESEIDSNVQSVNAVIGWRIATTISLHSARNEFGIANLNKYLTAMARCLVQGISSDDWDLGDATDLLRTISWGHGDFEGESPDDIIKAGFIFWNVEKEYDPAS